MRGEIEGDAAGVGDAKSVSSTSLWAAERVLAHCEASVRMIDRSSFPELNPLIPEEDAQPDFYYACAPGSLIQQARGWLAQGLQGGWSAGACRGHRVVGVDLNEATLHTQGLPSPGSEGGEPQVSNRSSALAQMSGVHSTSVTLIATYLGRWGQRLTSAPNKTCEPDQALDGRSGHCIHKPHSTDG